MIALLAAAVLGTALLWSAPTPVAQAKGPVKLTFCGERACVGKSTPRFTAAMLYGGSSHAGPVCRARVHTATAVMPRSELARRFLVLASRGLVGEQFERGYVSWRKVRGSRKADLARAVKRTGRGFKAKAEIPIGAFSLRKKAKSRRWHLREDGSWPGHVTCGLRPARG